MNRLDERPLIVQGDRTLILHTVRAVLDAHGRPRKDATGVPLTEEHPRFAEARDRLALFAELEKSPDYLHTYRITPVSIWNAAALGLTAEDVERTLSDLSLVPPPSSVLADVRTWIARYGLVRLERGEKGFRLACADARVLAELLAVPSVKPLVELDERGQAWVRPENRGNVKQVLIRAGYPVDDRGGYVEGDRLALSLRERARLNGAFRLRPYQEEAAAAFHRGGSELGGSGVIVLPCGAGKTVVALRVMSLLQTKTLVLTTNTVAVRQWREEILDKTDVAPDQIGEYTGEEKSVRPITITTYQMLTWRRSRTDEFEHFGLFSRENWGLVVYDEVHLLPAPIFRVTADVQARRRLGLTATLVREDGKEDEVFCLIGPKRYEVPWKVLEQRGFIATALCTEVRVPLDTAWKAAYQAADARMKFRIASENPAKLSVVERLIAAHAGGRILVIGQYLDQLHGLARHLQAPLITGQTPTSERERLYGAFKSGELSVLIVSKVGNFAIDLPDANVAIQVSGTFGSRQEEAQRLGRILRPKSDGSSARFYAVVTLDSREAEFAQKRQLFLTEQGYAYEIVDAPAGPAFGGPGPAGSIGPPLAAGRGAEASQ